MFDGDLGVYDKVDVAALVSAILNTELEPTEHRAALGALAERSPNERNPRLAQILTAILTNPSAWDASVPEAIVDLLATDPNANATTAMLKVLPTLLKLDRPGGTSPISGVRGYFYEALASRERDEDIAVWAEFVPTLKAADLAAILLDNEATPLIEALDPLELIGGLNEPERTNGIFSVIAGSSRSGEVNVTIRKCLELLKLGANRDAYFGGIALLADYYQQAKGNKRETHVKGLHAVLAMMDNSPRSAADKLTGKRPWAP